MRAGLLTLCLCACTCATVADTGKPVGTTHTAPMGALVVTNCPSALDGDDGGYSPYYLVDASTGAVTRWVPDTLPGGTDIISSAETSALYMDGRLKLWALSPDGTVRVIDEHPTRDETRFASDGTHRSMVVDKTVQWRTLDGKIERTFVVPDFPHHVFPASNGERAVGQIRDNTVLIDARGATPLLENQHVIAAGWSPDGTQVALVTIPVASPSPLRDRRLLWRAKLDGTAPVPLPLPERPGPGLVDRVFGVPQMATAVSGVVWTNEGLVILSNYESECWWGGRDGNDGCYWALYRLPPEGGTPTRISPRAFRCQQMFRLQGPK
jgi:hypothetical protein